MSDVTGPRPRVRPDRHGPSDATSVRRRSRRPSLSLVALGVMALLVSACAGTRGGRSAQKADPDARPRRTVLLTTADDVRAGSEAAEAVAAEIGLLDDAELGRYVDRIGRKLLNGLPRREFAYRFSIVDEMEPNAFALPGGHVYVSRGLLALINDEDELACVIGHEIVHVARRHAAQQAAVARQQNPLALPIRRAGTLAAYGRDMEREADGLGQQLCAAAGYDPAAMARFLRSLDQRDRLLLGQPRRATFLDTHPGTRERAAANSVRASELRWTRDPGLGDVRARYLDRIDGLVIGDRPETGMFVGELFLHPELDFELRLPKDWHFYNTNRAVGALAPRREAAVFLLGDLPSGELESVAEAFAEKVRKDHGLRVTARQRIRLGAEPALRYAFEGGRGPSGIAAQVTFFAFAGGTWRLVALAPLAAADRYFATLQPTLRSFGPLSEAHRAQLELRRLRIEIARAGEDVTALATRTGSVLPPAATALLNGLLGDEAFRGGELLKVVRREGIDAPGR